MYMYMYPFLLAFGIILLQEMSAIDQFPFPVYEVERCPINQSEYNQSNARINCTNDTNGSSSYICIPDREKSRLLEFCYPYAVGFFERGYCLVLNLSGYIEHDNCSSFRSGCPEHDYIGNKFFKYPKCQAIIKDLHCYEGDSTCTSTNDTVTETDLSGDVLIAIIVLAVCVPCVVLLLVLIVKYRKGRLRKLRTRHSLDMQDFPETNSSQPDSEQNIITIFNGYEMKTVRSIMPKSLCFVSPKTPSINWEKVEKKYMNYFVLLNKHKSTELINPRQFIKEIIGIDRSNLPDDFELFKTMCYLNEDLICTEDKIEFRSSFEEFETMCAFIQDNSYQRDIFHRIRIVFDFASVDIVARYFRTSGYKPRSREKCIVIPNSLNDLFIKKLDIYIIEHDTLQDVSIHQRVSEIVRVPEEIMKWEKKPRQRFLKNVLEGTKEVFRARGLIVGCSSAGKTTLLKRLKQEDIHNVQSTKGVDIHNEIFQVNTTTGKIEIMEEDHNENIDRKKTISMTDFAGQCAYYTCHQVYLSPRAFYILVTDMTKQLELKVGREQCQQDGTIFSDWTYKDYFEFWLRSLHVYCDNDTPVIIVATHRDKAEISQKPFFDELLESLPEHLDLKRHLHFTRYFSIGQGIQDDLENLKSCMFDLATNLPTWGELIPAKWEAFEYSVLQQGDKIMQKSELQSKGIFSSDIVDDMLRYYHETGMILNFNEGNLADIIILDVQWFVDAFKLIITDENHVKQEALYTAEWSDFNKTGELNDKYLGRIWKGNKSYTKNKDKLLDYMQRLGLIAKGSSSHYVPCMNKKDFDEHERLTLENCSFKSSILMFRFDFLPYFIFCRLVVSCMCAKGAWKTLLDEQNERKALYKNTAMFTFEENIVVLSVTNECILTQVFVRDIHKITRIATLSIRQSLIHMLKKITGTFHKNLNYKIGFGCKLDNVGEFTAKEMGFVPESSLQKKSEIPCPFHQRRGHHYITALDLTGPWSSNPLRRRTGWTKSLICCARQDFENERILEIRELNESRIVVDTESHQFSTENFHMSDEESKERNWRILEKLTAISRNALQIYFDSKFPPHDLEKILKTYKDEMKKGPYRFGEEQLLILFPGDGSCPLSSTFDVTIMYKLLRNYGEDLPVPSQGWGKNPRIGEIKETDDLERIRFYRNKVHHAAPETRLLEKDEFEMYWIDLSRAIMRLSNGKLKAAVAELEEKNQHNARKSNDDKLSNVTVEVFKNFTLLKEV